MRGTLRPAGAPPIAFDRNVTFRRSAIRQFRRETGRPAKQSSGTPVVLIVVLVLALAAAGTLGVAYARARRRLQRGQHDVG